MNQQNQQTPNKYHDGNKFFILGEFDDELQEGIIIPLTKKIEELSRQRDPQPIEIWINSNGGNGWLCMHLCHLVELAKTKGIIVKTIVTQVALSSGSILAVTGTKGHRYISKTAEHLIHYGQFDGYRKTTPLQIERDSDHFRRWTKTLLKHYQTYAEVPDLEEHMKDDNFWIEASKAIKWGLADKYMEEL